MSNQDCPVPSDSPVPPDSPQILTLPGRQPGDKYAYLIHKVFSFSECQQLITLAETNHFEPASLIEDPLTGQTQKNPNRNNDRVILFDANWAQQLYTRVQLVLPTSWTPLDQPLSRWIPDSCNNRLSFLRYLPGQHYSPHVDAEYVTSDGLLHSFITVQVYLNEDFTGGATRFLQEIGYTHLKDRTYLDVIPQTGSVLLFEHELLHTGCEVLEGCKYTIRSDIMFKRE